MPKIAEIERLEAQRQRGVPWKKWGPYLSERQWGTVREDYSRDGNAWDYFSHDQARSRTYRWGEDGIAGISDEQQHLCFALTLWNGQDAILKERLFGLTNSEGNHGEDVKEYYFYLDNTPTHSYMKYLYKYPQRAFPYLDLVHTNRQRSRRELEYELLDTGVFDNDRYFDVFIEYAKETPESILIRVSAFNRGPERATLHLLPTLWFRNDWFWNKEVARPRLKDISSAVHAKVVFAPHNETGNYFLYCEGVPTLLFTENETNNERIFHKPNRTPYVKDAINNYLVHGLQGVVNPERDGTKVAAHYKAEIESGQSRVLRLRLSDVPPTDPTSQARQGMLFGTVFDTTLRERQKEADEFYATVIPPSLTGDESNVMRQALAGMLWTKQFYFFDVDKWLTEHGADPFRSQTPETRNKHWHHMYNANIISMPDKWEYPWYSAWDLAFHVIALTLVDPEFGKQQLDILLRGTYLHPNGQLPAYEWNFGAVNPPVHAWSTIFTYRLEKASRGQGDLDWLERSFQKLLLNFTWWVNRKDRSGRNALEGGFLGIDNIGVFDRNTPLLTGEYLEQADGTAWMALFCQNMLEIAAELVLYKPAYADILEKFIEHYLWIAAAIAHAGEHTGMWDEEDGFFYDVLRTPDGQSQRLKVRSIVGLLPLCAVTVYDPLISLTFPQLDERFRRFVAARPELTKFIHDPVQVGYAGRRLASVLSEERLRRVLAKLLDEGEFLSPYGIRALSLYHAKHPYVFRFGPESYRVSYDPAESHSGMFGGNSNWRGPVWTPINGLIIRALLHYYSYYGNDLTVQCPTGAGPEMTLYQVAQELSRRLNSIFLKDKLGRRPVYGGTTKFQEDPYWRDHILFYEYFHGDNGAGLGASHQTGWTGIVARGMHLFATTTPQQVLELGKNAAVTGVDKSASASTSK